uniref:Uncharacterized protein n=1 Tax=Ditylenchus dipsaci TaxID=166011 RepID=A0A915EJS8_9BILA
MHMLFFFVMVASLATQYSNENSTFFLSAYAKENTDCMEFSPAYTTYNNHIVAAGFKVIGKDKFAAFMMVDGHEYLSEDTFEATKLTAQVFLKNATSVDVLKYWEGETVLKLTWIYNGGRHNPLPRSFVIAAEDHYYYDAEGESITLDKGKGCPCTLEDIDHRYCVYDIHTNTAFKFDYYSGSPYTNVIYCNRFKTTEDYIYVYYLGGRPSRMQFWDKNWSSKPKLCQLLGFRPYSPPPPVELLSTQEPLTTAEPAIEKSTNTVEPTTMMTCTMEPTIVTTTTAEPTTMVTTPTIVTTTTVKPSTVRTTILEPSTVTTTTAKPTAVMTTVMATSVEPTTVTTSTAEPTTLTTTTAKPTTTAVPITLMTTTTAEPTALISITTAVPTTATTTSSKPASVITTETATTTSNSRFSSIVSSAGSLTTSEDFSLSTTLISFSIEYTSEVPLSTVDGPTSRNHSVTASSSRIRSEEDQHSKISIMSSSFLRGHSLECGRLLALRSCVFFWLALWSVIKGRQSRGKSRCHSHFKEDQHHRAGGVSEVIY